MMIIVKVHKAGELVTQSELELEGNQDPDEGVRKAFKRFLKEHPDTPLLDEDVTLKFEKVE